MEFKKDLHNPDLWVAEEYGNYKYTISRYKFDSKKGEVVPPYYNLYVYYSKYKVQAGTKIGAGLDSFEIATKLAKKHYLS